jgi:hypothetical protein
MQDFEDKISLLRQKNMLGEHLLTYTFRLER